MPAHRAHPNPNPNPNPNQVLQCLHVVLLHCRGAYPDLWAVLKFVPKKNGLNPVLALLAREGAEAVATSVASLPPRALRRQLDDLQRALEQSWALISCYLTQVRGRVRVRVKVRARR